MIFLGKKLGKNKLPFIVAELSCNHQGSIQQAKDLIYAAKEAGADAVKIQVYLADEMTFDKKNYVGPQNNYEVTNEFHVNDGPWKNQHLYNLYSKTQTDYDLAQGMMIYAEQIKIPLFASVFSQKSLNWLEVYECPAYKIASFEITDTNLIRKVAKTAKPIVISTGMASLDEIDQAMQCVNPENCILLHCVSGYPTKLEHASLHKITQLRNFYIRATIGFSDHTRGITAGPLACAMGARMIEKHLAMPGTCPEDAAFSLHPDEFKKYVTACKVAAQATFEVEVPEEQSSRQFRRSLYVVKDIKKGDNFTLDNVKSIRPNYGLPSYMLTKVILMKASQDIQAGTALTNEHLH